jgi:vacuolar-type H+-ATPase subunit I/STV1
MNNRMPIEMIEDAPLTLQTRAALAMNSTHTERDLIALAAKNTHIVAVIDKLGRQQAHGAAMELKRARTTIAGVSKDARDDATQFQKAIIAEEKRLIAIIEPEEERLFVLRDAFDDEQACIRAEAEQAERNRITAIHAKIAELRNFLMLAGQCSTAERIAGLIEKLEAIQQAGYESFDEFAAEASTIAAASYDAMVKLHAAKVQDEEAAERAKAEQEATRIAQSIEAAKLAAERSAFSKEQAAFKAQQAAILMRDEQTAREVREANERAAYAAAINSAPVADAEIESVKVKPLTLRGQFEKTFAAEVWNPSDVQILDALCIHFGKSKRMVFERLSKGIDLTALELACFDKIAQ